MDFTSKKLTNSSTKCNAKFSILKILENAINTYFIYFINREGRVKNRVIFSYYKENLTLKNKIFEFCLFVIRNKF